jgi:signal transduction histidine kinase
VQLEYGSGKLIAIVGDNGTGGATPRPGGGLRGVERRLAAFDGVAAVTSPVGGPTLVTMELPCALSLART